MRLTLLLLLGLLLLGNIAKLFVEIVDIFHIPQKQQPYCDHTEGITND